MNEAIFKRALVSQNPEAILENGLHHGMIGIPVTFWPSN